MERSLRQINFQKDQDHFPVPNGHRAAQLQITRLTAKSWFLNPRVSPAEKIVLIRAYRAREFVAHNDEWLRAVHKSEALFDTNIYLTFRL